MTTLPATSIPENQKPWNPYIAKKWWESDVNEARTGTFNLTLYLALLEFRSDPERVDAYYNNRAKRGGNKWMLINDGLNLK